LPCFALVKSPQDIPGFQSREISHEASDHCFFHRRRWFACCFGRRPAITLRLDDRACRNIEHIDIARHAKRPQHGQIAGRRFRRSVIGVSEGNEALIENDARVSLWAYKNSRDELTAPKRFQFSSMSIDFQNGKEKRQHDHGVDEGR